MTPETNFRRRLAAALVSLAVMAPAAAFDLNSDIPIKVTADNARLDDAQGIATYTGDVELEQGQTRLDAERVVLYRDANGLSRIEASGTPARYRQPARDG
ncbi:MAG: LptA/OstA family protein, partial [Pseudomonadota bacterium]|nr:LptA/OstA family protein [Pseudomonadota bacterium]